MKYRVLQWRSDWLQFDIVAVLLTSVQCNGKHWSHWCIPGEQMQHINATYPGFPMSRSTCDLKIPMFRISWFFGHWYFTVSTLYLHIIMHTWIKEILNISKHSSDPIIFEHMLKSKRMEIFCFSTMIYIRLNSVRRVEIRCTIFKFYT